MKEEGIEFQVCKGVFYNPNMNFCRSLASLAVGAIEEKIVVCDAFAATGIRGIRYAKENNNVKNLILVDVEDSAAKCAKNNARKNKVKAELRKGNISKLVFDIAADFVEVDPFGTPAPYLYDVFRMFNPLKKGYLSVTATDVAVLCGGKTKACMKNYHSKPLNNEFTHENGLRIMMKKMAEVAAEFNMGMEPLVSVSDRHYLKSIVRLTRSATAADDSLNKLGFVEYCHHCGYRRTAKFPGEKCLNCGKKTDYAGPLWTGELHHKNFLGKMEKLNEKRKYTLKKEIGRKLELLKGEVGMPPYFYSLHGFSKKVSPGHIPRTEEILSKIKSGGYRAEKTHFSPTAIKTDAPYRELKALFGKSRK